MKSGSSRVDPRNGRRTSTQGKLGLLSLFTLQGRAICFFVVGVCLPLFIFPRLNKRFSKLVAPDLGNHNIRVSTRQTSFKNAAVGATPALVDPPKVHGKAPRLLVGILSTAQNFKRRKVIRDTWLNVGMNLNWEPWFIIGRSNDAKTRSAVKEESAFHRDMIIFDSIQEGYYTISAKVEAYFRWAAQAWGGHNNHPQYIMKADDDSAVEIPMLMEALKHLPAQKLYMGRPRENSKVIRPDGKRAKEKYAHKWTVTKEEYARDIFPPYMGGPGYILSYDLAKNLVKATNDPKHKPFKFEDVNIGMILDGMDYEMYGTRSFFLEPTKYDKQWIGSTNTFVHHRMTNEEMKRFALDKKLNPELPWRRFGKSGNGGLVEDSEEDESSMEEKRAPNNQQQSSTDQAEQPTVEVDDDEGDKPDEEEGGSANTDTEDFTVPISNSEVARSMTKKDLFRDEDNSGNVKSYFKHYSFNPPPKAG